MFFVFKKVLLENLLLEAEKILDLDIRIKITLDIRIRPTVAVKHSRNRGAVGI